MKRISSGVLLLFLVGCTHSGASSERNHQAFLARDILSRMERDFFHHKSEDKNIAKIVKESDFEQTDLNSDGKNEIVVKLNWLGDGRFGFSKTYNFVRGAQDGGPFYLYGNRKNRPVFLGEIRGGIWRSLPTKSCGFADIETYSHWASDKSVVNRYRYSNGQYKLMSSVLWRLSPDGTPIEKLKVFEDEK